MRAPNESTVSPGVNSTWHVARTGPSSTPSSTTRCTITPECVRVPATHSACARPIASTPGSSPGRAGCRLITRRGNRPRKVIGSRRMYPARTTRSGDAPATASARRAPWASRDSRWARPTQVAVMPCRRARSRAIASRRSLMTPTTCALIVPAAHASMTACRLVPVPDARTARRTAVPTPGMSGPHRAGTCRGRR